MTIEMIQDNVGSGIVFTELKNGEFTLDDFDVRPYEHEGTRVLAPCFIRGVVLTLKEDQHQALEAIVRKLHDDVGGQMWFRIKDSLSERLSYDRSYSASSPADGIMGSGRELKVRGEFHVYKEESVNYRGRKTEVHRAKAKEEVLTRVEEAWEAEGNGIIASFVSEINRFLSSVVDRVNDLNAEELEKSLRTDAVKEDYALSGLSEEQQARHQECETTGAGLEAQISKLEKQARQLKQEAFELRTQGALNKLEKATMKTSVMPDRVAKMKQSLTEEPSAKEQFRPLQFS